MKSLYLSGSLEWSGDESNLCRLWPLAWKPHRDTGTHGRANCLETGKLKVYQRQFLYNCKTFLQFTIVDTPGFGADDILEENRWIGNHYFKVDSIFEEKNWQKTRSNYF